MQDTVIHDLATKLTEGLYENHPDLIERYGERGRQKCIEDNEHHYRHLDTAYQMGDASLFTNYSSWLQGLLSARGMAPVYLLENFVMMKELLGGQVLSLDEEQRKFYLHCLDNGIAVLKEMEAAF
ncbi:hypothetical protein [Bacillus testis]|uniref:hypothetical protein n=1 Tax=Bacillus testis TaxID=1622072 RepID=UPI00067EAC53|nr:hypothetical protein [Bacillus testis]